MGIGGLDSEFNAIFRRAFASRVFPPEVVEQLGEPSMRSMFLFSLYLAYFFTSITVQVVSM